MATPRSSLDIEVVEMVLPFEALSRSANTSGSTLGTHHFFCTHAINKTLGPLTYLAEIGKLDMTNGKVCCYATLLYAVATLSTEALRRLNFVVMYNVNFTDHLN